MTRRRRRRGKPGRPLALVWGCLALSVGGPAPEAARGTALPEWALEAAGRASPEPGSAIDWLHQETFVEPLAEGGVRVRQRLAGRILTVDGKQLLSTHSVAYREGDEVILLEAWSKAADGTVRRSERKKDVTDMAASDGFSVYGDGRVRQVGAPGAVVGAFVAFESAVERRFDSGAQSFWFGDAERPVAFSRFSLAVPEGLKWTLVTRRTDGEPAVEEQRSERGVVLTARDLRPLPPEPYRPVENALLPSVSARWWDDAGGRGYETWTAVANWYRELTDPVLQDAGEAQQLGQALKPEAAEGFLNALSGAFDFAARAVRYVSIQIGVGGYRPYSPAVVCKNRFGDCKDKAFLVRSLVGAWDVRSYPILVRTRDLGEVDPDVPSPGQFNHCVVAVVLPDGVGETLWNTIDVPGIGRLAVLDATARQLGPWDLPLMDQGTLGLLVHDDGGALVRLPSQPAAGARTSRRLEAALGPDGMLTRGTLTESWSGTAAGSVRGFYSGKREDQHQRDVAADLQGRFPGMQIADYRIEGLDNPGLDILERTTVAGGRLGRRVGDLLIVEPGRLARGLMNALPAPPRRWPLHAGQPRLEAVEVTVAPPAGWTPEGLPDGVEIQTEDVVAEATWTLEDGHLVYRRSARLLTAVIPVERYAVFRDQIARIERADREGIVLVPSLALPSDP